MSDFGGMETKDGATIGSMIVALGVAGKAFWHNQNANKRIDKLEVKMDDVKGAVDRIEGYLKAKSENQ